MSAFEKEKIFVELREYHENEFPAKLATPKMTELRKEFEELEDKIINMILSLVNGKLAFVDLQDELKLFKAQCAIKPTGDRAEDTNRTFFISKIDHLNKILEMAEEGTFRLKIPRGQKTVPPVAEKVGAKVTTKK